MKKNLLVGRVSNVKENPKDSNVVIISIVTNVHEDGTRDIKDLFIKRSMAMTTELIENEDTKQQEEVPVFAYHKGDFLNVEVMTYEQGEKHTKSLKKGGEYYDEDGVKHVAQQAGDYESYARNAGFNVLSIDKTSRESILADRELFG